jgi:hypothetical protein
MSSSITSESRNYETTSESDLIGLHCPTCNLVFDNEELFKVHYHSDLHHYNSKRKIVGLKPVSQEQFTKRRLDSPRAAEGPRRERKDREETADLLLRSPEPKVFQLRDLLGQNFN